MTQAFQLKRVSDISPSTGEELGNALARFADDELVRLGNLPGSQVMYWGGTVAQVLYLAAEAFEQGASASIGHNRTDRYLQRANTLRARAAGLEADAKGERDQFESVRLLKAFTFGYEGRSGAGFSFDDREAFLLGQLFAKEGRETPKRLVKFYQPRPLGKNSDRDHLLTDLGQKFVVDYPGGRTVDAVVTQID